jgi:hypothetical protein
MRRIVVAIAVFAVALTGCSKFKTSNVTRVIVKDIPLEEQQMLLDKYVGRVAWTRMTLDDLTERETPGEPKKKVVPRDTKITIVDMNFVYNGSLLIQDPRRRKIVVGLNVDSPLSVAKIEDRLADMMWFDSPVLRQVGYIRKWGTRTARAVVNHEVFIGMPSDAALESWGIPTAVNRNEIGGKNEEQWVYKQPLKSKYIYVVEGKVSKWED